ncbi:MAG: EAL domain-containing protein [Candidatus Aminicenantes bacterium]|nr:EAL domain-containing protein [Candidatus Aminicenantes bacterium]
MLSKKLRESLPEGFRFRETSWYHAISGIYEKSLRQLLLTGLITATIAALAYILIDLGHGDSRYLIYYLICLAVSVAMLFYFLRSERPAVLTTPAILLLVVGFALTVFLPNSRDLYLLIFFCFPPLVLQLTGIRRGSLWTGVFFVTVLLTFVLNHFGFFGPWNITLTLQQILVSLVVFGLMFVMSFASERQKQKYIDQLVLQLSYDTATNLPNREVLIHSIPKERQFLFAIVHIENFGELGTIFGYEMLDEILQFISRYLQQWSREFNYSLYRLRGNDFGLLIPRGSMDRVEAEVLLNRICAALRREFMAWGKLNIHLNIKLGASFVDDAAQIDFLSKADLALKDGIRSHRAVSLYKGDESIRDSAYDSLKLYSTLTRNLEGKTCRAYFQPIIDTSTGEVVWFESLLRLRDQDGFYVSPSPFLSLATSTGLDSDITEFMLKEAFTALRKTPCDVSLNVTFKDLLLPEFEKSLFSYLKDSPPSDKRLILEIIERDELVENEACRTFLERARAHGCKIAIDDFGSGYSNFSRLIQLPMDILKIDGSLTQKCLHDEKAQHLIRIVVEYCRANNIKVVAEHVDRPEIAKFLASCGVHYLQGYHFGIPQESLSDPATIETAKD